MSNQREGYDFTELRPVIWMFSGAGIAMFLGAAAFGLAAFLWFLLAGSLLLLVASFFLEPLMKLLGGAPAPAPVEAGGPLPPQGETPGTDAA